MDKIEISIILSVILIVIFRADFLKFPGLNLLLSYLTPTSENDYGPHYEHRSVTKTKEI